MICGKMRREEIGQASDSGERVERSEEKLFV